MNNFTLNEIETFIAIQFVLFGGVITIAKVLDIVKAWRKPGLDIQQRQADVEQHLDHDNKRQNMLEESDRVSLKAQLAMIEHMKTGNGKEKLEEATSLINNYLINR